MQDSENLPERLYNISNHVEKGSKSMIDIHQSQMFFKTLVDKKKTALFFERKTKKWKSQPKTCPKKARNDFPRVFCFVLTQVPFL